MCKIAISSILLMALLWTGASSQVSGLLFNRAGIISGNRVMTSFGNWGVIGQPADFGSRGAWIHPANGYIGDLSIFLGLELPIRDYNGDGIPDTVHSVITCLVSRPTTLSDTDPITGAPWTFMPDSGYFNPAQVSPAIRSIPSSWPLVWPDHPEWGAGLWDGLYGKDSVAGNDETYFRMDDQNDRRFNVAANNPWGIALKPDSAHPARMGHGISVAVRYIQSAHYYFQDVLFRVYDIRNEGTTDYAKVVFGTLNGTYVGITSTENFLEWGNDIAIYYPTGDFILTSNFPQNTMMNPLWVGAVGIMGEAFVESPAGTHIASYNGFVPAVQIALGDDEDLWDRMRVGSYVHPASIINDTVATQGEDMDYTYGSGYFSLKAAETKRVVTALVYGYSKAEIQQKILMARSLWNSHFNESAVLNVVALTNLSSHRVLSGSQLITWNSAGAGGTVSLWYSGDAGGNWIPVVTDVPNTGSASWDTRNVADAAFGLLRIYIADTSGRLYGFQESSSSFTVDNAPNGTPFVKILDSGVDTTGVVTATNLTMHFLVGDPEGAQLTAVLSYRSSPLEAFIPFESYSTPSDTASQSRLVSLLSLPNSEEFQLRVSVSDGTLSWSDSTAPFKKRSTRVLLPPTKVHFKGLADVTPTVSLVDRASIRYNEYTITFSDTAPNAQKTFTVLNPLGGSSVIPLYPGLESAVFDGMALYADDIQTDIDKVKSRWNHVPQGATWNVNATVADLPYYSYKGYRQPYDYLVVFDDAIVDTTAPFDLVGLVPLPVNYRVLNAATGEKIRCAAVDESGYKDMILLEDIMGRERATWRIYVTFSPQDQPPGRGDTVIVVTRKGLSYHDTLTLGDLLSSVATGPNVPGSYAMEQNFPNPFNPSTSITYAIGAAGFVTLKVYDILGREVSTLVSERQSAGIHSARFDGTHLASGVYFYRLHVGAFTDTKKLLLIH